MIVGVPKEIKEKEFRVGIVPAGVKGLVAGVSLEGEHGFCFLNTLHVGELFRHPVDLPPFDIHRNNRCTNFRFLFLHALTSAYQRRKIFFPSCNAPRTFSM